MLSLAEMPSQKSLQKTEGKIFPCQQAAKPFEVAANVPMM